MPASDSPATAPVVLRALMDMLPTLSGDKLVDALQTLSIAATTPAPTTDEED